MAVRYAVLDKDGVVVNHVLIDDPLPKRYWPGYGATLVPLEDADVSAGAALDVVVLKIADIPQIGDTLNVETGELTKFVPELLPQLDEKGVAVLDEKGEQAMVSSAPLVELAVDVDPQAAGKRVIDLSDVEVISADAIKVGK